jgi:quinol-cytochrome oxidoreductase complex cytochrome b subunit
MMTENQQNTISRSAETVTSSGHELKRTKQFYPDYLVEILFCAAVGLELLFIVAMACPPPLGRVIDFTRQFQPRSEWYFLWLFEVLLYFPGKSAFIGAVLFPMVYFLLLMMIPFIDRGRHGRLKAKITACILLGLFVFFTVLRIIRDTWPTLFS